MAGAPLNPILDLDYWLQQDLMFMTDRYLQLCQRTAPSLGQVLPSWASGRPHSAFGPGGGRDSAGRAGLLSSSAK